MIRFLIARCSIKFNLLIHFFIFISMSCPHLNYRSYFCDTFKVVTAEFY